MSEDKRPWDMVGNTEPATKEEFDKFCEQYKEQTGKPKHIMMYGGKKMSLTDFYTHYVKIQDKNGQVLPTKVTDVDKHWLACIEKAEELKLPLLIRNFGRRSSGSMKVNPVIIEAVKKG
jgi:hypothetical protein